MSYSTLYSFSVSQSCPVTWNMRISEIRTLPSSIIQHSFLYGISLFAWIVWIQRFLGRKSNIICSTYETHFHLPEASLETFKSLLSVSESEINLGDEPDHYIITQHIFSFLWKCRYYVIFCRMRRKNCHIASFPLGTINIFLCYCKLKIITVSEKLT